MISDVKEFDTYSIQKSGIVSDYDLKVLYRLYQPIIGYAATCLYVTLLSEASLKEVAASGRTHKRLFLILKISKDKFLSARKKLESIGLLNTMIKENHDKVSLDYLYLLQSPKAPNDFFADSVLNGLLLKALGEVELGRTQYFYVDNHNLDEEYVDITSVFEDSFVPTTDIKNISSNYSRRSVQNVNSNFDINKFITKMSEHLIPGYIFTSSVKKEITRIKLLFELDESILEKCVISSINFDANNKKSINLNKLNELVEEMTKKVDTGNDEKNFYAFASNLDETDPYEYYKILLDITALMKSDILLIKQFKEMNIPDGVINAVLYYCVINNKNKSLNFNGYVNKVMSSVVKEKLKDAYQTLIYFKNLFKNNPKNIKKSPVIENKNIDLNCNANDNEEFAKILSEWGK